VNLFLKIFFRAGTFRESHTEGGGKFLFSWGWFSFKFPPDTFSSGFPRFSPLKNFPASGGTSVRGTQRAFSSLFSQLVLRSLQPDLHWGIFSVFFRKKRGSFVLGAGIWVFFSSIGSGGSFLHAKLFKNFPRALLRKGNFFFSYCFFRCPFSSGGFRLFSLFPHKKFSAEKLAKTVFLNFHPLGCLLGDVRRKEISCLSGSIVWGKNFFFPSFFLALFKNLFSFPGPRAFSCPPNQGNSFLFLEELFSEFSRSFLLLGKNFSF